MTGAARRWWAVAVYAGGIFVASSIPSSALPSGSIWDYDKLIHLVVFLGLGFFLRRAARRTGRSIFIGGAYGIFDEVHQSMTPGRAADPFDAAADLVGVIVGVGLALWAERAARSREDGNPA